MILIKINQCYAIEYHIKDFFPPFLQKCWKSVRVVCLAERCSAGFSYGTSQILPQQSESVISLCTVTLSCWKRKVPFPNLLLCKMRSRQFYETSCYTVALRSQKCSRKLPKKSNPFIRRGNANIVIIIVI